MKICTRLFILLLLLLIRTPISAQFFDIGQDKASTKWKRIDTGNFSIIYPEYYRKKAFKIASEFNLAAKPVSAGLNANLRNTPLILHPLNPVSNAYASWAPRRIEIFTIPPQDTYAQPWTRQLALHEYRHIVQLTALNKGFTHYAGFLFGQQAAAFMMGLFVPSWFVEGDAVASETASGNTGRGRVPAFSQTLRAQLAEKGSYSYSKASLGSYRDFVPDIYTFGYHMVAASRYRYGARPWKDAMNMVARKPWTITPFNRGLKKTTGLNKKGIYRESLNILDSIWAKSTADQAIHIPLKREPGSYTNYLYPHRINDSVIVALKKSFSEIPAIVLIDAQGKEKKIHSPGYLIDGRISYENGKLLWAEYIPHVRWESAGKTSIVIYDLKTGKIKRNAHKGRLFSPVMNRQGNLIAAIEINPVGDCFITIISSDTVILHRVSDGIHASTPCWSPGGEKIAFIATGNNGKALAEMNCETGDIHYLNHFSGNEISNPVYVGEYVCFTGAIQGKNQLIRIDAEKGDQYIVTNVKYGADFASVNKNDLVYSDYTADGYRIAQLNLQTLSGKLPLTVFEPEWPLAEALSAQETGIDFNALPPDPEFSERNYKKVTHLFGIHSWAPVFVDIGGETVRPGVSVMSQNLLSTMFVSGGYDYNIQEETGIFRADLTWKGWFPVLKATVSSGQRASTNVESEGQLSKRFTWNENNIDMSISQRLNLSRGANISGLYGEAGYNFTKISLDISTPSGFIEGSLTGLTYKAAAYWYSHQAYRDLGPRHGFYADIQYRHTPFSQIKAGNILGLQCQLFLAGFGKNHSILFYGGYQQTNPENYSFSNIINISRGYNNVNSGDELQTIQMTYRMPLFYPDIHLAGLLYIKRVRANLMYDNSTIIYYDLKHTFSSYGFDLLADFHLFGISSPVSAGIRTLYIEDRGKFSSGLLFSVNFREY